MSIIDIIDNLWKSIPTTLILRKSNLKKIFLSNS